VTKICALYIYVLCTYVCTYVYVYLPTIQRDQDLRLIFLMFCVLMCVSLCLRAFLPPNAIPRPQAESLATFVTKIWYIYVYSVYIYSYIYICMYIFIMYMYV